MRKKELVEQNSRLRALRDIQSEIITTLKGLPEKKEQTEAKPYTLEVIYERTQAVTLKDTDEAKRHIIAPVQMAEKFTGVTEHQANCDSNGRFILVSLIREDDEGRRVVIEIREKVLRVAVIREGE